MKKILCLVFILFNTIVHGQVPIFSENWYVEMSFEDTLENKYILFDTNNVWFVTKPEKEILFIPSTLPEIGEKALITDTNDYYAINTNSSFCFKLILEQALFHHIFFRYKYDFEKNKDGGIIETSYDNGKSWENILFDEKIIGVKTFIDGLYTTNDKIESYNNSPGYTGLQSEIAAFDLEFYYRTLNNIDTVLMRFTISSDSVESNNEGWLLDDFRFSKYPGDGISNPIKLNNSINIFPNPTSDILYIKSDIESINKIEIISPAGIILPSIYENGEIFLDHMSPGIYLIRINQNFTKKIMIN